MGWREREEGVRRRARDGGGSEREREGGMKKGVRSMVEKGLVEGGRNVEERERE